MVLLRQVFPKETTSEGDTLAPPHLLDPLVGFPTDITEAEYRDSAQFVRGFVEHPSMRSLMHARDLVLLIQAIKASDHPAVLQALLRFLPLTTIDRAYDSAIDQLIESISVAKVAEIRNLKKFTFSDPSLQDAAADVRDQFPEDVTAWATRTVAEALKGWQLCKRLSANEAIEAVALIRIYVRQSELFHSGFEATFLSRQQILAVYDKAARALC